MVLSPERESPDPTVSVVINTLDRARSLDLLLDALEQITYPSFEVVVVVGPCTDDTEDVVAARGDRIKVLHCEVANLSLSRNLGIAASAGEYVAFIDDDAVPEPQWLDELMTGFLSSDGSPSPDVAAVGGWVYDHTGYTFQCTHTGADRTGNARPDYPRPLDILATPGSLTFPYAPGGNGVYRRDVLVGIGGFDEEFEYYLEETDVSARLIDHGWGVRQIDGGAIHHKFLPSGIRSSTKVLRDRYSVIKNKVYFSMVNGLEYHPLSHIIADNANFAGGHYADIRWHVEQGNMTAVEAAESGASIERGLEAGFEAGSRGRVALGFPGREGDVDLQPFLPFATLASQMHAVGRQRLRLCFVSQTIPPEVIGGIGRYFMDLARELASRGHEIHVITTSNAHSTVDLEDRVWIHRIAKPATGMSAKCPSAPGRIAGNACAVADEVRRIADRWPLDAVYAAMWDVEHLEVIGERIAPVVTALVTTLGITLRTRPEWVADESFMDEFCRPMLELERYVMEHSDHLHGISEAIVEEVQVSAGIELDRSRITVSPIGSSDLFPAAPDRSGRDHVTVLFVGRFEKRKGIDLLLAATAQVLAQRTDVSVVLAGRNDLPAEHGAPYASEFQERHRDAPWFDRVDFPGVVDDDRLEQLLAGADIFVAPSRFESFGLVYTEAMMASLPVIALDAGAAREVIVDGSTGLLVSPDVDSLVSALHRLCDDSGLRAQMGLDGRARFESMYSVGAMADRAEELFRTVADATTSGTHGR